MSFVKLLFYQNSCFGRLPCRLTFYEECFKSANFKGINFYFRMAVSFGAEFIDGDTIAIFEFSKL
jgi:hypothetical protein